MVLYALENMWGGELYVPKIKSYKILDIATAVAPECTIEIIGIRPGEKIHEEMISSDDSFTTYDLGKYFVILPRKIKWNFDEYIQKFKASKVELGFRYASNTNSEWESIETLKELIFKIEKNKIS